MSREESNILNEIGDLKERIVKLETLYSSLNDRLHSVEKKMDLLIINQQHLIKYIVLSLLVIVGAIVGVKFAIPTPP